MEGLGFGLGVLLAIFGPLLLIPLTWLVHRLAVRRLVTSLLPATTAGGARWLSLAVSACLLGAVLAISYVPGKRAFDELCAAHATPVVSARVWADGFFRTRLYPYEARRWLETFAWVEAPHMYEDGAHVRYTRAGDEMREERVASLRSRYGVREVFSELDHGILMTEKTVYELAGERELARAASLIYEGGPLSLLFGAWAMSSCPEVRTEQGSEDFQTFYDLETIVLRAPPDPPSRRRRPARSDRHPRPGCHRVAARPRRRDDLMADTDDVAGIGGGRRPGWFL